MKIILTGCAGFIGSRVCSILIEQGHNVIGIDNLNEAYDIKLKEYRLNILKNLNNFEFHKTDIMDREGLLDIFENNSDADAVINLAAMAGVRASIQLPREYMNTNVIGTINLLELCKTHRIDKFILASTSSLYGENKMPFKEDMNTDRTLSPYAASKKAAENICYTYHILFDLDISVLRYFTVYGPASRPDMSPFRFIKWIAEDEDVIVFGDGNHERDFTFVDDIAEGTILSLKKVGYEIINLGNDKPIKLKELIRQIEIKMNKNASIVNRTEQLADVNATWADISKAKNLLNWVPKINIEEGISLSVDWYENNRDFANSIRLH
jgi:nucleoside-diphosphate-sugar epimerase